MAESCSIAVLLNPVRPEFPVQVRCPRCGWVDTFDNESTATLWAWRHDHTHQARIAANAASDSGGRP